MKLRAGYCKPTVRDFPWHALSQLEGSGTNSQAHATGLEVVKAPFAVIASKDQAEAMFRESNILRRMAGGVAHAALILTPLAAPGFGIVFLSDTIKGLLSHSATGLWSSLWFFPVWILCGLISLVLWITTSAAAIQYAEHGHDDPSGRFELETARGRVAWFLAVGAVVVLSGVGFALCPDCPRGSYIP